MSDLKVSVVVPARNAGDWLAECLDSIRNQHPHEMIVIDGCSTMTRPPSPATTGNRHLRRAGLPAARMLGARHATGEVVALIDADVVLPPDSLRRSLAEFESGGYDGLQFGLASEADGPGYWGAALAWHHNHSRVRSWFGVSATLMRRDVLLAVGFDDDFRSGEDVELRIRLEQAGYRLGVSDSVVVRHRFGDTFDFARDQWLQDGAGWPDRPQASGPRLAGVSAAAGHRAGCGHVPVPAHRVFLPYWMGFFLYNSRHVRELLRPAHKPISVGGNAAWFAAARIAPMVTGFLFWRLRPSCCRRNK